MFSKFTVHSGVFLALTAFTVAVAAIFQNPLLVYTAVFLVTTNLVLYIWAQYSVRGLSIKRRHPHHTVMEQPTEIGVELLNQRGTVRYGTLGFDLHPMLMSGEDYSPVAFLVAPPGETVSAAYSLTPARRGVFKLGPFYLYGGDPFGFYKCWRKVETFSELLVLPRPVPFEYRRPASVSNLSQDEQETISLSGESTEFLGIREYMQGDSLRRVHWRSTARLGTLISRLYELNVAASISALVLVDQALTQGSGADTPLEYSLRMVASLGFATTTERFHFSYLALMGQEHDTFSGTGERFYQELALKLARLDGYGPVNWDRQSKLLINYLPRGSSLMLFTAAVDAEMRRRLRQLAVHFRSLSVITFDSESFAKARRRKSRETRLSFGEGYLVFEVAYGDNLSRVLEQMLAKSELLRRRK